MSAKLKIALFLILLFAGLFLFTLAEAPAQVLRWGRPLAVVAIFGYLVYAAWVLLRSSNKVVTPDSTDERCGDDCGCKTNRPQPPKAAKEKASK